MSPPRRIAPHTFASVIRAYLASDKFARLAPSTRKGYRLQLVRAQLPETLGAYASNVIRPSLVQAFLDGLADRPGAQAEAHTALKSLERWAVVRDLLPHAITTGTEVLRTDGAHEPWSDAEVALAEEHAKPALARVVTLTANTGQRASDIVKMRASDLETYQGVAGINVIQQKTKLDIWIPLTAELAAAMATWQRRPGFLCLKDDGTPWSAGLLSCHWNRERAANPALKPLEEAGRVLHGLRATACVRLNRAGATARQIADMVGMSVQTVERYLRKSLQRDNALAAVIHLDLANAARTRPKRPERK